MKTRELARVVTGMATSDGAGVRLRRSLGQSDGARLDPFLMLDEFASDDPDDYLAGFPPHPHRGFETVTYMLEGHMLHEDHLGNRGDLRSGGVQWMTAAAGIIHSEMPQQESGRMHGFQLWINLPAREKMKAPSYRDIPPEGIPEATFDGGRARIIAGAWRELTGAVHGVSTEPLFLDVALDAGAMLRQEIPAGHNAFLYMWDGEAAVGAGGTGRGLPSGSAGLLGDGDLVEVTAGDHGARFLLLAAKPLGEPVVQYGPFVMNTREEIAQALADYRTGTLAREAKRGA
ncbi:MAG TPA: pirin family protein [Gammaproteobacteria bacterium]|nr:pirin family protein [Gammaproteobacteria bacterium]